MPKTRTAPQRTARTARTKPKRTAPQVRVNGDQLHLGDITVTFQRTLRIPDDGGTYPLPPSLGSFPLRRVEDYADTVPQAWLKHGGVFLPMYQREAMWLNFSTSRHYKPTALKVAVGKVCALSGRKYKQKLHGKHAGRGQDYLVVPNQPWLDGINAGDGTIKQFVAMPLGMGYTVEGQITGEEKHGGLQLCAFEPQPGRFPDRPPYNPLRNRPFGDCSGFGAPNIGSAWGMNNVLGSADGDMVNASYLAASPKMRSAAPAPSLGTEMGLAAGGRMHQEIHEDPHGVGAWDEDNYGRVFVHLVNSEMWTAITGEQPPATPVTAQSYTNAGLPWYDLYNEGDDIAPSPELEDVATVSELDDEHGFAVMDDSTVPVPGHQVKKSHGKKSPALPPFAHPFIGAGGYPTFPGGYPFGAPVKAKKAKKRGATSGSVKDGKW